LNSHPLFCSADIDGGFWIVTTCLMALAIMAFFAALQSASVAGHPDESRTGRRAARPFAGTEHRSGPRRDGAPLMVFVTGMFSSERLIRAAGRLLNRSSGGLCVIVGVAVDPGTLMRVLPCHAPESTPWTSVEVRNCLAIGDGWRLGCRFVEPQACETEGG
jgi:hypothetical protein